MLIIGGKWSHIFHNDSLLTEITRFVLQVDKFTYYHDRLLRHVDRCSYRLLSKLPFIGESQENAMGMKALRALISKNGLINRFLTF